MPGYGSTCYRLSPAAKLKFLFFLFLGYWDHFDQTQFLTDLIWLGSTSKTNLM